MVVVVVVVVLVVVVVVVVVELVVMVDSRSFFVPMNHIVLFHIKNLNT